MPVCSPPPTTEVNNGKVLGSVSADGLKRGLEGRRFESNRRPRRGSARVPAERAGVFLNFEQLVGALLGVLVLGEKWGQWTVIGAAAVVSYHSGA